MKTFTNLTYSGKRSQDNNMFGENHELDDMWKFTGKIRYRKTETSKVLTDFEVKITEWQWREHIVFWGICWYGEWIIINRKEWRNTKDFTFTFDDEITYQECTK